MYRIANAFVIVENELTLCFSKYWSCLRI